MKQLYLTMAACLFTFAGAYAALDREGAKVFEKPVKISSADEIITTPPAGEKQQYSREAYSYYIGFSGGVTGPSYTDCFVSDVVFDGDDVYLQNPIFEFPGGSYIKGTREGDKVTFSFPQPVAVLGGETVYINRFNCEWTSKEDEKLWYFVAEEDNCMTLTINADGSMTMDPSEGFEGLSDPDHIYGLSLADNDWGGYGEWNAVYTKVTDVASVMPEGVTPEVYHMRYNTMAGMEVNVAFDGDNAYISNLSPDYPQSCIVGTVDGNKVTFPSHQYMGIDSEYNGKAYFWSFRYEWAEDDLYGEGWNMITTDAIDFTWDPEAKTLVSDEAFLLNFGDDEMAYLTIFDAPQIKYPTEFTPAAPENPVFILVEDYNPDPYYLYAKMEFWLSMFNVNDQLMDTDRVYYNVYFGDELYTFTPEVFINLKEPMTDIPFSFKDTEDHNGYEIKAFACAHYIYFDNQEDINMQSVGLQAVYKHTDGTEYKSDLVYYNPSGVEMVLPGEVGEVVSVEYRDLNGVRVERPGKGIYVKTTRYANGTAKTVKVVK